MGTISIRKKQGLLSALTILLLLGLTVYFYLLSGRMDLPGRVLRQERIRLSRLISEVESGNMNALGNYPSLYADNTGRVLYSSLPAYPVGSQIDLHRFSSVGSSGIAPIGRQYFQSPIVRNGAQTGILAVELEENASLLNRYGFLPFLPALLLLLSLVIVEVLKARMLNRDILSPMKELDGVLERILRQDDTAALQYDYDGEIGRLCHNFEKLREEYQHTLKQEKERKRREKELLACISHDLKTPLSSVSGYVEGLRSHVAVSEEDVSRYLEIISDKVAYINKLINDILEQSKQELNEFPVRLEEVYAGQMFADILKDLSADILGAGMEYHCGEIPDVLVYADYGRMRQVMENLIGNSMKYRQPGIRQEIKLSFQIYDKELVTEITDNGRGIAVEDLPFIFDKFYRGQAERGNIPGSGLGLSISRSIIQKHGGKIECDSIRGRGATIRFSLRLC